MRQSDALGGAAFRQTGPTTTPPASNASPNAGAATNSISSGSSVLSSLKSPNHAVSTSQRTLNLVSPSGASLDQTNRMQSMLAAANPMTAGARIRSFELLHFFMSSEAVSRSIEDSVNEVLKQAGLKPFSDSPAALTGLSPKVPNVTKATASGSRSPQGSAALRIHDTSSSPGLDSEDAPMEQPPALQLAVDGPREDFASATLEIGMDDLPSMTASANNGSLSITLNAGGSLPDDSSPRRKARNLTSHPKSPRSTNAPGSFHSAPAAGHSPSSLTPHYHIVDEVDAAHARGALSPRSISPAMQLNQDMQCVPHSPLDTAMGMDSSTYRRSPSGIQENGTGSNNNTPRRGADDHLPGRPSRSPSPAGSKIAEDLAASRSTISVRRPSGAPLPDGKPKFASYQEIPRFYFAEGKPQTQSTTLVGPHSNKHENPHLTIFEGVAVPVGAQAQLLLAQQQMNGGGPVDLQSLQPQGPKLSPMLPLAIMEDEDVLPFIQREFARLPAPPPKPQVQAQPQRAAKGTSVLRRPTTSTTAPSKQEQAYRQALTATMHRVCTQAFGLPRYFAQLVYKKLAADAEAAMDEGYAPARPGTSNASGAPPPVPSPAVNTTGSITVAQVKEFYEKHLRFKSIVRRMFEVLIATSKVPTAAVSSASLSGALGGAAPSALASGSTTTAPDNKRNYLLRDDFAGYLEILLESHPGLGFLRQTSDFQGKYTETVVIRIFYDLDRLDRGRITWQEFENSRLPDAIRQVDATDDINTVLNYFSYEHFYVLYCRFWELDEDRDLLISQQDLQKYSPEGTMNPKIVERVFQGHGRKLSCKTRGKMNYEDFVWFCLSEEDKTSPRAIRYWFKVLDTDGDGVLCGHEMEMFYTHTKKQLLQMTTEGISFADVLCQVSDMLPFKLKQGIRLGDMLAQPQAAHVALNMLMNVVKFLQFEQRDPFVAHHDRLLGGFERNDWDRFARQEYDRMAQEADGDQ